MSPGDLPFGPARGRARRGRALVALGFAALFAHALFLAGLEWTWPAVPSRAVALQIRAVGAAPNVAPDSSVPTTAAFEAGADAPAPRAADEAGRRDAQAPMPTPIPRFVRAPKAPPVPAEPLPPATAATVAAPADEPIPLYRTRMPPAATLHYVLRRGAREGSAALQWQPTAEGYAMRLDGSLAGVAVMSLASEGAFDSAGLAPARYTDRRQRRQTLAVNFRRDAGRLSFSGSSADFALAPGTQDRLTWMLQLAAVLAAEPARREPGARVAVPVAGVRGAPVVWSFRSAGMDDVVTAAGPVSALRLVRESRGLYDPTIEVWLDPQRHYLPLRTLQHNGVDAQTVELVLERLDLVP